MATSLSAAPLTLKRVLLSSGGVGYFEYEAQVEGATELTLEAPLNQMDDILKSLIVYDDLGAVNTITLPGKESLDQIFRDLPFLSLIHIYLDRRCGRGRRLRIERNDFPHQLIGVALNPVAGRGRRGFGLGIADRPKRQRRARR